MALKRLSGTTAVVMAAGATALFVMGGIAVASIPSSGTGVIYGCYTKTSGSLRLIDKDASQTCSSKEQQIQWNAQGPAGPAGPTGATGQAGAQGATGAQGPVGATGAQGLPGVQGPQGLQGPAGASGGRWFTGSGAPTNLLGNNGDFYLDTGHGNVYDKSADAWVITDNLTGPQGPTGDTGPVGPTGREGPAGPAGPVGPAGPPGPPGLSFDQFVLNSGTISNGSTSTVAATCPAGDEVISGGYRLVISGGANDGDAATHTYVALSGPTSTPTSSTWQVQAFNDQSFGDAVRLTVVAGCGH